MLGLVMVAPLAVNVVLKPRWAGATVPLQWLGLFMTVRVLGILAEQVLVSQRLTRFTMRFSIVNFVVMIAAFTVAARWKGVGGVAAAWIVLSPVTVLPLLIVLARSIRLPLRDYARALLPAVAGSGVMCLALFAVSHQTLGAAWPVQVRLAAQVIIGGLIYGAFVFLFFGKRVLRYTNFLASLRGRNSVG
jgi:O-antigen/teichoic acid export membrane protein